VSENPHLRIEPILAGAPLDRCTAAAVLVHGRDQDQEVMLSLVQRLDLDDVAYLLPIAAGRSWYDGRYFDPEAELQPQLEQALAAVRSALDRVLDAGVDEQRIVLAGFSQGGSLVAELVGREPRRLMGVAVLTGSLIGPAETRTKPSVAPGLPMYLSSGRDDPWLSFADAQATADAFAAAGASVRFEALEEREHAISDAAVAGLRRLLRPSPAVRHA
jgi:phospholipase/carboxylesterase